jgi:ankyrin repeat protein
MKKLLCWAILVLCMAFQTPLLEASDFKWDLVNALSRNDIQTSERLIRENAGGMPDTEKKLMVNFVLNYTRGANTKKLLEFLKNNNIHTSQFDLYIALNRSHDDSVILFILDQGIVPNGEILLLAAEKKRFNFAKQFIEMGADVNYRYPQDKAYADGMTALLYASKWNNLELVRFLVEHGADVNWRARDGRSAASIAHENGQTDIYNYLKEQGADFEPDLSSAVPVPEANGPPAGAGAGISSLLNSQAPGLKSGTYRLSGGSVEIKLTGSSNPGSISYTNNLGRTSSGFFLIDGGILTLKMEARSFIYRIVSDTSFSGNGETWVRTGD